MVVLAFAAPSGNETAAQREEAYISPEQFASASSPLGSHLAKITLGWDDAG